MANPLTQEDHLKKSHSDHHAHFPSVQNQSEQDDNLNDHESQILVEPLGENSLNIRLGFLQYKHVYQVQFSVPDTLGQDVEFDPLENLHVKIESVQPSQSGKGHDLVLMFSAFKEKIMEEALTLCSKSDSSNCLKLTFHARVLGKGKGKPSLKRGIHCVRIEWDEESDKDSPSSIPEGELLKHTGSNGKMNDE